MQHKNKYTFFIAVGLFTLLLLLSLFGYGIYRFHWQGPFIQRLSRLVPYPAILVDWEVVTYRAYLDDLRTLERYWSVERENKNVFLGIPNKQEIRERLVNKLVEEKIIQRAARSRGITVLPEELEAEWQRVQTKTNGANEISFFLDKAYGWNEAKFKTQILTPFLLEQKVKDQLINENKSDSAALQKRAKEIYALAQAKNADFSTLAKQFSDDRLSAKIGGDLGYFNRGTFEPEFEKTVFAMKIGDISEPIKSSYGYHIVKLDDLLYDDKGIATQASIKHILIKAFDFDDWLAQQKNRLAIYRLVL